MRTLTRFLTLTAFTLLALEATPTGQTKPAASTQQRDYSQEAYVIEQSRTSWRFENDGTGRRELHLRVKVQSEAAIQTWGQLAFPYNSANEQMDVVFVRVLKGDGSVITAPASAVQDLSSPVEREAPVYTDTREKHVTVPGLRPGDVLDLSLAIIVRTPLAPHHFWAEHDFLKTAIVLDDRLQMDVPSDRSLTLKTRPGLELTITEHDGRRIYQWHTSHLDNDETEKKTQRVSFKPEPRDVRVTTFANWEEVGSWYRDLERSQRAPNAEVRRKASELTKGRTTDLEKIRALYEYVAANFRYVSLSFGVGRYQPHAAADVLHNGYGDCKDKHTLLASLSESIGLRASAALINSSVAVDPDFPSPSQFDHVMTRVSVGTDEVWLDTTTEVAPFRLLMPRLRKKQALVVPEDAPARLEESPAATPMVNSTSADVDATLSESGTLAAHVRLAFSGDFELVMRSIFRRTPKAQWRSIIDAMSGRAGLEDAEFSNWKVADPAALSEQFTIEYEARKANVVTWGKKTFDLDLPLAEWIPIGPADDSNADASSIELGPSREASYELRIELPASYIARTPLSVSMKRDYGEYRADYKVDGRVFMVRRSLTFGQSELPASRKGDYAAFRRSVSGDLKQSLGLEASGVAAIGATESLKVEELYDRGTDAVESSHFAEAVTLLKRATELEPKHRAAWTNLGRAYMGLHQTDAAIDAFRKQVEIDPYDRYAYKNLGHAYWRQQKFGDAEVAFKKQLEVDPLDEFAHEGLGGIYLEQHRCEAAAPELEKAISLSPKNASLRVRLGEALLGCGHRDRALAAFGRAVEIDATPLIWNDIAYQLASNSTDLELGQRYAESAVAAMTAASRTVSLEHVTTGDLRQVASLGAYWDTLGWVYFAKADLDRAEKYVHASWLLMQHADVGDHLGQIYEKRGRRDDAVQAYALALNAERPDARIRERLAALVGVDHVDETVRKYRGQLLRDRSIAVDVKAQPGTADFFVLLDNQPGSARVENVAFISGNEGLRSLAARLRGAKYDTQFPDEAPAKILRRGTLSCGGSKLPACTFMLMLPGEAREAQRE